MVAFLQANPDKAAAWASVQGIAPAEIPAYVAGLTPFILRSDTAVTNHGFSNGAATTVHSVLRGGTAILVDKFGVPRTLCYCGNPLTPADILKIEKFLNNCKNRFDKWELGQVVYPGRLSLNMGQSAAYVVAVDIRTNPLPAEKVIPAGATPQTAPISVQCVLGARLVPVGKSLEVDNKDWILREFTPTGFLNWSWSVTALAPYDQELRLELQPAVELEPALTTQGRYILPPIDSSHQIGTFITSVHVEASWIQRIDQWWKDNWKIILGVAAAIGAALISIIKWGGDLGQAVRDSSAKWRDKQKHDNRPEG